MNFQSAIDFYTKVPLMENCYGMSSISSSNRCEWIEKKQEKALFSHVDRESGVMAALPTTQTRTTHVQIGKME